MGTNMLYRIAIPVDTGFQPISPIFLIDCSGNQIDFKPDFGTKRTLTLSKLNTGEKSFVEKGNVYELYYYDGADDWILSGTKTCGKDSVITFENLPANTLFKLIDTRQLKRTERPFTYENEEQVFW
jgi:hypothetical protein